MRLLVLVCLLAGCRQIFGLDDPQQLARDADIDDAGGSASDGAVTDAGVPFATCSTASTLVACLDFNGSITDTAGNSLMASNVAFAAGQQDQAVALSTASKLTVTDSVRLDVAAVTMQAWVHPDTLPAPGLRAGIWDTDGQYGMFILSSGALLCTGGGTANSLTTMATIPASMWSHVACTDDGSTLNAYIDGHVVGTMPTAALTTATMNGAEIGGNAPDMLDRFVGRIDLLRVYSVARTAAQICTDAHCM